MSENRLYKSDNDTIILYVPTDNNIAMEISVYIFTAGIENILEISVKDVELNIIKLMELYFNFIIE